MTKKTFEKIVQEGIRFIARFFPHAQYLYFSLLSAALVWAIKGVEEWREKIFSWEVWLDPSFVRVKSEEFILDFFSGHPDLSRVFAPELASRDLTALREVFYYLYPIVGLEDPFLSGLFYQELMALDYRSIVEQHDLKVSQAIVDIEAAEDRDKLLDGLEGIAREMASFGTEMITQTSVQRALAEIISQELEKRKD